VRVAASEAQLLTIARALTGAVAPASVSAALRSESTLPDGIGPTCRRLLEATLARGAVLELARRGGWRPARHLAAGGEPGAAGRLWDRHAPPTLRFSATTMHLLRWLSRTPLATGSTRSIEGDGTLALGDELLAYLACDLLVRTGCGGAVGRERLFARSPLCWLGFPDRLAPRLEKDPALPDFAGLVAGPGALLLEALQPDLARRWVELERGKRAVRRIEAMSSLGRAQEAVLAAFTDAAAGAARRDLAGFLVSAARELLTRPPPARSLVESLETKATIRERAEAHRAAGAFLRGLGRLSGWLAEARTTRFFDEGYAAAQLLLAEWEFLERGQGSADGILRQLEALDATAEPRSAEGRKGGGP
jgi:hypothetical protein